MWLCVSETSGNFRILSSTLSSRSSEAQRNSITRSKAPLIVETSVTSSMRRKDDFTKLSLSGAIWIRVNALIWLSFSPLPISTEKPSMTPARIILSILLLTVPLDTLSARPRSVAEARASFVKRSRSRLSISSNQSSPHGFLLPIWHEVVYT